MNFDNLENSVGEMNRYGEREVGITHPDTNAFFKIADNGDMYFFADHQLGMVFHVENRSVTIMADSVRFLVKDMGVSINDTTINENARKFTEPTLIPYDFDRDPYMYEDADSYTNDSHEYVAADKIIDPNTKLSITREEYRAKYGVDPSWDGEKFS